MIKLTCAVNIKLHWAQFYQWNCVSRAHNFVYGNENERVRERVWNVEKRAIWWFSGGCETANNMNSENAPSIMSTKR